MNFNGCILEQQMNLESDQKQLSCRWFSVPFTACFYNSFFQMFDLYNICSQITFIFWEEINFTNYQPIFYIDILILVRRLKLLFHKWFWNRFPHLFHQHNFLILEIFHGKLVTHWLIKITFWYYIHIIFHFTTYSNTGKKLITILWLNKILAQLDV